MFRRQEAGGRRLEAAGDQIGTSRILVWPPQAVWDGSGWGWGLLIGSGKPAHIFPRPSKVPRHLGAKISSPW